jgi:hypothetical protein
MSANGSVESAKTSIIWRFLTVIRILFFIAVTKYDELLTAFEKTRIGVRVYPRDPMLLKNCIRISLGTKEANDAVIAVFKEVVQPCLEIRTNRIATRTETKIKLLFDLDGTR